MSQQLTGHSQRILWGRAIAYGLLTETMLIVVFIVGLTFGTRDAINIVIAIVGSFVLPLVFAMVLGRRLQARFVLHGVLIGAAAFVVFMGLSLIGRMFQPDAPGQPLGTGLRMCSSSLGAALAAWSRHVAARGWERCQRVLFESVILTSLRDSFCHGDRKPRKTIMRSESRRVHQA